jgi:UDP-N-acetylglucosamine--N-acetylmuramyl-(pentapeptide) pyrophosphoryl-undecaprenol N-acetylglucosamine transferase
MRYIIAGGGTGGHIFPAVAIARALQRLDAQTQFLFVGALGKMEMEKVPKEGFKIVGLDIAGFNRSDLIKNLSLPYKIINSHFAARKILKEFKPDAVIGVGGFASMPVLFAAQLMHIPTFIQEQNSFAGKSNKILGRKAKAICVAYENMAQFFPANKIVITGNPVRKNISQMNIGRQEGQTWLGLDPNKKTLLIIGGSLGAKSINEAIDLHLEELLHQGLQVLWQTGKPYYQKALQTAGKFAGKVKVMEFIYEMEYAYASADLVISRSGALAISELCIAAKPVIFVPYPFAAENHQVSNAMALVKHNAALMVPDADVKTELLKKLKTLLHDDTMQQLMTKNLKTMAITNADDRIANIIVQNLKEEAQA